jgi:hypothetical protein
LVSNDVVSRASQEGRTILPAVSQSVMLVLGGCSF